MKKKIQAAVKLGYSLYPDAVFVRGTLELYEDGAADLIGISVRLKNGETVELLYSGNGNYRVAA